MRPCRCIASMRTSKTRVSTMPRWMRSSSSRGRPGSSDSSTEPSSRRIEIEVTAGESIRPWVIEPGPRTTSRPRREASGGATDSGPGPAVASTTRGGAIDRPASVAEPEALGLMGGTLGPPGTPGAGGEAEAEAATARPREHLAGASIRRRWAGLVRIRRRTGPGQSEPDRVEPSPQAGSKT